MIPASLIYKYRYDLALKDGPGSRLLMWVTGMMVFLAALAFAFNLSLTSLSRHWSSGISSTLTVELPAESADVQKVVSLLSRHPDIEQATPLSPEQVKKLVQPWLGKGEIADTLPLPQLIDIRLKRGRTVNLRALGEQLNTTAPGSHVTDHMDWLKNVISLGRALRLATLFLALVMAALAIVTITGIIHARFDVNRRDVEILHLMGASDDYIARQFQNHAFMSTLKGAFIGTFAAIACAAIFGFFIRNLDLAVTAQNRLSLGDWLAIAAIPLFFGCLIATITARLTLMRELMRMP